MKLHTHLIQSVFGKAVLATAALGGFLLFAGAPSAKADNWNDCNRRANYSEWRYHEAAERYGPNSREARRWAHERHEAYECMKHARHESREQYRDRDYRYDRDWR